MNTRMTLKQWWQREKYVAIHAQSWKFRAVKYLILILIFGGMWWWKGWPGTLALLACLLVLSFAIHFFYRWKTNAWTESWGGYKKLELPEDDA